MAEGDRPVKVTNTSAPFGFVYLLTVIGAAVYFVEQADGFWSVVLGLLKAVVWPAFAAYRALELLHL
jgi:hypothetical protein